MAELSEDLKQTAVFPGGSVSTQRHQEIRFDFRKLVGTILVCFAGLTLVAIILVSLVLYVLHRITQRYPAMSLEDTQKLYAFWSIFTVMTLLVFSLAIAITAGLMWPKTFSLSDALSAPSPVQPKIDRPQDVLLLGSTSRLIAFVGLLGILCLALGVGYSVVYDIVVRDESPQLTQVCWFLGAMASLFAPYLASQVKEAMVSSKMAPKGDAGDNPNG
jgi:MFS superfamily sulfate permease-like transporter